MSSVILLRPRPAAKSNRPFRALFYGEDVPVGGGGGGGPTAPAFVQQVAEANSASATSPHVLTLGAGITTAAGNTLILVARGSSAHFLTGVTDSKGNTWTVDAHTSTGVTISIASAHITTPLVAGDTITETFNGTAIQNDLVWEYTRIADAGRVDVSATAAAGSTVASQAVGPTAAVVATNAIAISGIATNVTTTPTPSAGWASGGSGSVGTSGNAQMADELVAVGATPSITWSFTPNAGPAGAIVVYKGT